MRKQVVLIITCLLLLPCFNLKGYGISIKDFTGFYGLPDSVEGQVLYNGRAWRNMFYNVKGDQFLFSDNFLKGTVTIDKRSFTGIVLKYDILNDEILTINSLGIIIQLNKEMVNGFTILNGDETFRFQKLDTSVSAPFSGYANILYDGKVSLLARYRKEILKLNGDSVYMKFKQSQRLYLRKENDYIPIGNKKDLLDFMADKRQLIRNYIRNNRLKISRKDPHGLIPVVEYYNTLIV